MWFPEMKCTVYEWVNQTVGHSKEENCISQVLTKLKKSKRRGYLKFVAVNVVLCGFALKAGSSWVRFPVASLKFFIALILPAALRSWGRLSLYKKRIPGLFLAGYRRPVRTADKFRICMCRKSGTVGAWDSRNSHGLSRPEPGTALPLKCCIIDCRIKMLSSYGNDVSLSADCQPQIIYTGYFYLHRAQDILNTRDELLHGKIYKATSVNPFQQQFMN